ncbi:MAG: hypothetical protein HYX92_21830 [Chloroflexi bacterium]|nr:hypothetical protein [Chloroflexota bacterium]
MTTEITIEAKVLGQRRPSPSWKVPLPDAGGGARLCLRDLITEVVLAEVSAFRERQEGCRLIQVLTSGEIAEGVENGKVDPGGRDIQQVVEPQAAVTTALQAFEDGLYLVFVDGEQQTALDREVFVQPDSRLAFVRLTALAGG